MIRLVGSTFYREEETKQKLAAFILHARWLSMGPECARFEESFAEVQGRKHCVVLNSGSSANLALIQALLNLARLRPGDAVGFSACTWSTNVMPLLQLGLTAVPIDIELDTLNVSPRTLRAALADRPLRAVFLTHLLGACDDIARIRTICAERGMLLLEDTCEALGTVTAGTRLGNFGLASTFSFYVGHHLSTIEGGAVCTDDDALADMLRIVRAHGWDRNLDRETQSQLRARHRVASSFYSRYTFYERGFNLRPTEIVGFLGNAQLSYLPEVVARRQENYRRLSGALTAEGEAFLPLKTAHLDTFSSFAFPLLCRTGALRDALVEACEGRIEIRPIVGGDLTQQPFFRRHRGRGAVLRPVPSAAFVHAHGLYLPNHPELTTAELAEMRRVVTETRAAVAAASSAPVRAVPADARVQNGGS